MANDNRTEKATPQKRKKEREKGNLAKSKDLNTFLSLTALAIIVYFYAETMVKEMAGLVQLIFSMMDGEVNLSRFFEVGFSEVWRILVPIFIVGLFFQILNYVMQVKFLFSWKVIKPDIKKLNPVNYVKNLFSRKTIVDILKSFVLMFLLGYIAYMVLKSKITVLMDAVWNPWELSLITIFDVFKIAFMALLIALFFIALFDFIYQKYEHEQKIKMKKEDIKDEQKNTEGNPETKRRQRTVMQELLSQDVTQKVPEATVIITNPTHFSIALRYERGVDDIPVVLAKGEDELALYIRTLAKEHDIPLVENKPLARSLYFNVETGDFIDEDMYAAVIQVMRYLISTNQLEW